MEDSVWDAGLFPVMADVETKDINKLFKRINLCVVNSWYVLGPAQLAMGPF